MFEVVGLTNATVELEFGSAADFVRSVLVCMDVMIVMLGVTGNSLVLIGSIRYGAIDLDQFSVLLLENIAVADLLLALLVYLPQLITLSAGGWVLGRHSCFALGFLRIVPGSAEVLLIAAMACSRLKKLHSPLSTHRTLQQGKLLVWTVWFISVLLIITWIVTGNSAEYGSRIFTCRPNMNSGNVRTSIQGVQKHLYNHGSGTNGRLVTSVCVLIIITNSFIILIARQNSLKMRGTRSLRTKGVVMVCSMCCVFIISYAPFIIMMLIRMLQGDLPPWFDVLQQYSIAVNVIANPFIYSFTNDRFSNFIRRRSVSVSVLEGRRSTPVDIMHCDVCNHGDMSCNHGCNHGKNNVERLSSWTSFNNGVGKKRLSKVPGHLLSKRVGLASNGKLPPST